MKTILTLLALTASAFGGTLVWDPNSPEDQVLEYVIHYDGREIGKVAHPQVRWTIPDTLATGGIFTVYARSNQGISLPSDPLRYGPPTKPKAVRVTVEVSGNLTDWKPLAMHYREPQQAEFYRLKIEP